MIVGRVSGRAIVKIDRLDSEWVPYDIEVEVLEDDVEDDEKYYEEDFECMTTGTIGVPEAAENLEVGESVTVEADFCFTYFKDYWGEYDMELYWENEKIHERRTA